jgi:hypothetical protein
MRQEITTIIGLWSFGRWTAKARQGHRSPSAAHAQGKESMPNTIPNCYYVRVPILGLIYSAEHISGQRNAICGLLTVVTRLRMASEAAHLSIHRPAPLPLPTDHSVSALASFNFVFASRECMLSVGAARTSAVITTRWSDKHTKFK